MNKSNLNNNTTPVAGDGEDNEIIKHKLIEAVGYFLIAFYHIIVVIVLLNMLIAMMANSYNEIYVSDFVENIQLCDYFALYPCDWLIYKLLFYT
jgi:hypothetical protein